MAAMTRNFTLGFSGYMLGTLALALGQAAPASARAKRPTPQEEFAPTYAPPIVAPAQPTGSIFQIANGYTPLTSGSRASMVGDVLTICARSIDNVHIRSAFDYSPPPPSYIERNKEELKARYVSVPRREEIPVICDENAIVEFYSR